MLPLETAFNAIEKEGVYLFSHEIQGSPAFSQSMKGNYAIFLDLKQLTNTMLLLDAVYHEYGHCKTGCTHQLNTPYQLIGQHETRANRAAVHEFLPFDMLMKAIDKGNKEPWELADALGMPEKFVRMAVETYKIEGKLN